METSSEQVDESERNAVSQCCCQCVDETVMVANLCISTGYFNRFLNEIIIIDPAMKHVATSLGSISVALHELGGKIFNHLLEQNVHFSSTHLRIFDPLLPSWKGNPTTIVIDGNQNLIDAIHNLLSHLKFHNHLTDRKQIKQMIVESNLQQLWQELDDIFKSQDKEFRDKSSSLDSKSSSETKEDNVEKPVTIKEENLSEQKESKSSDSDAKEISDNLDVKEEFLDQEKDTESKTNESKSSDNDAKEISENLNVDEEVSDLESKSLNSSIMKAERSKFLKSLKRKTVFVIHNASSQNYEDEELEHFLRTVNLLNKHGATVLVPRNYLENSRMTKHDRFIKMSAWDGTMPALLEKLDIVINVSNDGSLVNFSNIFQGLSPPVISLNYDEIDQEDLMISTIMEPKVVLRHMRLTLDDSKHFVHEVTLVRSSSLMSRLNVWVNNKIFTRLDGDGVIISTPTGSKFYSLKAGGPEIHPSLECVLLTPLASRSSKPVILPANWDISVSLAERSDPVNIELDGEAIGQLSENETLAIKLSEYYINELISPNNN